MRWLACVLLLASACAVPIGGQGDRIPVDFVNMSRTDQCKWILEQLRKAYLREDLRGFMSWISPSYVGNASSLRERVDLDGRRLDMVLIDVWHDRATGDPGTERILDARWERRYDNRLIGERVTDRGTTSFVFREERAGYRLVDQRGQPLFGISPADAPTFVDFETEDVIVTVLASTITVDLDINNNGSVDIPNVVVRLLIDGKQVAPDRTITATAAVNVVVTFTGIPKPSVGSHTATGIVDPQSQMAELVEINNRKTVPFVVP